MGTKWSLCAPWKGRDTCRGALAPSAGRLARAHVALTLLTRTPSPVVCLVFSLWPSICLHSLPTSAGLQTKREEQRREAGGGRREKRAAAHGKATTRAGDVLFRQVDAALQARAEGALATAAGVDLRLEDNLLDVWGAGRGGGQPGPVG